MSRLQTAHVVETRHGVGTFILAPADRESVRLPDANLSSLLDIMAIIEFRIDLEGAAALAAGRRTEKHLKQIAAGRFEVQVLSSSTDVLEHDVEFHLPLARASGNCYSTMC